MDYETAQEQQLLFVMSAVDDAVEAGRLDAMLAEQIFAAAPLLKAIGTRMEQTQKAPLERFMTSLRKAACRDEGALGTHCRMKIMEILELRAMKWRPNLSSVKYYVSRAETLNGGGVNAQTSVDKTTNHPSSATNIPIVVGASSNPLSAALRQQQPQQSSFNPTTPNSNNYGNQKSISSSLASSSSSSASSARAATKPSSSPAFPFQPPQHQRSTSLFAQSTAPAPMPTTMDSGRPPPPQFFQWTPTTTNPAADSSSATPPPPQMMMMTLPASMAPQPPPQPLPPLSHAGQQQPFGFFVIPAWATPTSAYPPPSPSFIPAFPTIIQKKSPLTRQRSSNFGEQQQQLLPLQAPPPTMAVREEIRIANADSGKVMGVKGKRVAIIEQLSGTVISFQKQQPQQSNPTTPAAFRLLTVHGPHAHAIEHAKQLIAETIKRNVSPRPKPHHTAVGEANGLNGISIRTAADNDGGSAGKSSLSSPPPSSSQSSSSQSSSELWAARSSPQSLVLSSAGNNADDTPLLFSLTQSVDKLKLAEEDEQQSARADENDSVDHETAASTSVEPIRIESEDDKLEHENTAVQQAQPDENVDDLQQQQNQLRAYDREKMLALCAVVQAEQQISADAAD